MFEDRFYPRVMFNDLRRMYANKNERGTVYWSFKRSLLIDVKEKKTLNRKESK